MNQRKEKTEVKYMQSWEERIMIKQEGIAEGRTEGEKALLKSLIEKKMAKKYSAEEDKVIHNSRNHNLYDRYIRIPAVEKS